MIASIETTILPVPDLHLYLDKCACNAFLDERGQVDAADDALFTDAGRCFFFDDHGTDTAVVLLVGSRSRSLASVAALLSHEASHIVDHVFEVIGEEEPGAETKAYVLQAVMLALFCAYERMTRLDFEAGDRS